MTLLRLTGEILCQKPYQGQDIAVLCPVPFEAKRLWGSLTKLRTLESEYGVELLAAERREQLWGFLSMDIASFAPAAEAFLARFPAEVAALREKPDRSMADYLARWPMPQTELSVYRNLHLLNGLLAKWVAEKSAGQAFERPGAGSLARLERYDVTGLDAGDQPLSVDIVVYITEGSGYSWPLLKSDLELARAVFAKAGVGLAVRSAEKIRVPAAWQRVDAIVHREMPTEQSARSRDFYDVFAATGQTIAGPTAAAYKELLALERSAPQTIVLVTHRTGIYHLLEFPQGKPEVATFEITAISYPAYALEDRVDPALIRIIGLFSFGRGIARYNPKAVAHELGHKLINVSHEAEVYAPADESWEGGSLSLMLYGFGAHIGSGETARWHRERLARSPHLYRLESGGKIYNPPYLDHGHYRDPIYGNRWIDAAPR